MASQFQATIEVKALLDATGSMRHVSPVQAADLGVVTAGVLESMGETRLKLTATDLSSRTCRMVEAEISGSLACVVDVAALHAVLRKLPKTATLRLEHDGNELALECRQASFAFATARPDTAPSWEDETTAQPIAIMGSLLSRIFASLKPAIDANASQAALAGLCLTNHGGETPARFVATNGHWLALYECAEELTLEIPPAGILIPAAAIAEIARLAGASDDLVTLLVGERIVEARSATESYATRAIDARFPDYRRPLSTTPRALARAPRDSLIAAVEQVLAAAPENRAMRLELDPAGAIALSVQANRRRAAAIVDCAEVTSPAGINLNGQYLLDGLKAGTAAEIELRYEPGAEKKPIFIAGGSPDGFAVVLMPLKG